MTQANTYNPYGSTVHGPPATGGSIVGVFAIPIVVMALLWAVSYPQLAAAVVGGALVAAALLRLGFAVLARRLEGGLREIDVPGLGTVEFRVTPR